MYKSFSFLFIVFAIFFCKFRCKKFIFKHFTCVLIHFSISLLKHFCVVTLAFLSYYLRVFKKQRVKKSFLLMFFSVMCSAILCAWIICLFTFLLYILIVRSNLNYVLRNLYNNHMLFIVCRITYCFHIYIHFALSCYAIQSRKSTLFLCFSLLKKSKKQVLTRMRNIFLRFNNTYSQWLLIYLPYNFSVFFFVLHFIMWL
jgi:hypothetical protein